MKKVTNDTIRETLESYILDDDVLSEMVMLEGNEFAPGVIGFTDDGRLVYSYERLVESLAEAYGSEEDAIEWLEYNTLRSLPYMESENMKAPIIIHEIPELTEEG